MSLFSCAGFGDLGLEASGIHTISACEIVNERAELMQKNFPNTHVFIGDVWELQDDIISHARSNLSSQFEQERLFSMTVTNPCQGLSSNGMGRISSEIKKGTRQKDDPRNRLILPALNIIDNLNPKVVIFENVSNMKNGIILNENDEYERILSILYRRLSARYVLRSCILNAADYGVPQNRKRLITIAVDHTLTAETSTPEYYSDALSSFHPKPTHGPTQVSPHVTLKQCIGHMPPLDARDKCQDQTDIFHRVPVWNPMQYFCMQHTPEDQTAFHNKMCVYCNLETRDLKSTQCMHCNATLPRPIKTQTDGSVRLVRAYKTAYRRMSSQKPANALTTNSGVISSDVKGHWNQNRTLSLREIMIVASIDGYPGQCNLWKYNFPHNNDKLIRDVIGECVAPLLSYKIGLHLQDIVD